MSSYTLMDGTKISGRVYYVSGQYRDDGGIFSVYGPRTLRVVVDGEGRAWPDGDGYDPAFGKLSPLIAERWPDATFLGERFCPDDGEFERCGIAVTECGGGR